MRMLTSDNVIKQLFIAVLLVAESEMYVVGSAATSLLQL